MRDRLQVVAVVGGLAAVGGPAAATAIGAAPAPQLEVAATDHRLEPAPAVIRPGLRTVRLVNRGAVRHDLLLRRLDARGRPADAPVRIGPVAAGRAAQKRVRLVVGRYALICTVSDHAARGMTARLVVRR
jgi:plastocyanin